jgi:hypothetical protein
MNEFGWFLLIALAALSVASMTIRGAVKHRGPPLVAYLVASVLCASCGASLAHAVDPSYTVLGALSGLAAVELGPAIATGVRRVIASVSARFGRGEDE